ncbi:jg6942 [Pararge aegeria aegeria]|uniref:Jg6942 protein n=1 Tax=Pararge aegeria aegeria TaxID=348720 RepID=A0A8S4S0S1_9NEOP|nr:jg6942 [Pararge aegeria aegeria]
MVAGLPAREYGFHTLNRFLRDIVPEYKITLSPDHTREKECIRMTETSHRNKINGTSQSKEGIDESNEETKPKYWDPLTDGVKWIEKYAEPLEKFFERLPEFISTFIATFAVFTFGSTLRGEWVVILVTALKQIFGHTQSDRNMTTEEIYKLFTSENLKMENFAVIFISAHFVSYGTYFAIGGFLHDYTTYILHRLYHTPWLYKNFHKLHHKYKQPTAFSVTAIHPVEIMHVQLTMCLPLFTLPVHWRTPPRWQWVVHCKIVCNFLKTNYEFDVTYYIALQVYCGFKLEDPGLIPGRGNFGILKIGNFSCLGYDYSLVTLPIKTCR